MSISGERRDATQVLVDAMAKLQDSKTARVVVVIDSIGPGEDEICLDSNVDITVILGMLRYAQVIEEDIIRGVGRDG